jgi:hypothetical protein
MDSLNHIFILGHNIVVHTVAFDNVHIVVDLSPVYTTLNFWYGTDKIGTRTTFLVLGLPI